MNLKRVLLAGVASFVVVLAVTLALDNGTSLFTAIYADSQGALRPETERLARLPYLLILSVLRWIVFAYLYARSYGHSHGIAAGIKLGLLVAVIVVPIENIGGWVFYPISLTLPLGMIPYQFFEWIVSGVVVGLVYKPKQVVRQEATAARV